MLQYNNTMNFLADPQNQYLAVKRLSLQQLRKAEWLRPSAFLC